MSEDPGTFIAVEGIDGSGKSTQLELLADKLREDGHDVLVIDFPRYEEPSGYFAREYMNGTYGRPETVSPYTSAVLFALDHYQAGIEIRDALSKGKVILADRFAGSNMAYQGMKFAHAEERRGFYIWLDNLEFRMLGIPRPQRNLVMDMPAEQAGELQRSRGSEDASQAELNSASEVYNELCQLFPRDFTRIDCVRSGKLLDSDRIHEMVWKSIEPFLPAKPKQNPAKAGDPSTTAELPAEANKRHEAVLKDISVLLAARIAATGLEWHEEPLDAKKHLKYFIPKTLNNKTQAKYKEVMDKFLEVHAKLNGGAAERFAGNVLPLARLISVRISGNSAAFQELHDALKISALPESQDVIRQLAAQIESLDTGRKVETPTDNKLQETHGSNGNSVRLVGAWPRKELDLLPHMLYAESSSSFREIEEQVAAWSIARKIEAFQSQLKTGNLRAFSQVTYVWDFVVDFELLRHLLGRNVLASIDTQEPTPRLGYHVPEETEEAGLSDAYETCFDLSAQLHSIMQSEDHAEEAAYAVLGGHRVRFKMSLTADSLVRLFEAEGEVPGLHLLASQIQDKLAETHPMSAEHITRQPVD